MIALRRQPTIHGYYWQVSDEPHYIPFLSEFIIEVGRREASGFEVTGFQSIIDDEGLESLDKIYETNNQNLCRIDVWETKNGAMGSTIRTFRSLGAVYTYLARVHLDYEPEEVDIAYSISDPVLEYLDDAPTSIICYTINVTFNSGEESPEAVNWVKEGF